MEQWSILSDNIVYVWLVGYDEMSRVDIKMVDYHDHRKMHRKVGKEGQMMNIDFGESPEVLKAKDIRIHMRMLLQKWIQLINLMKILI